MDGVMPAHRTVPAVEAQKRFGYDQDEAIRSPVLIFKTGRPKTVLMSYEDFLRLKRRDRRVYSVQELPDNLATALLDATVAEDLADD